MGRTSDSRSGIDPPNAAFGARVRALRLAAGLSQSAFARRAGLAPSSISKIETGAMSPTYDVLLRLAKGLRVDLAELFAQSAGPEAASGDVLARLAISRRAELTPQEAGPYTYLPLATGIRRKLMDPTLVRLRADDIRAFGSLIRHPGEEFVFVVEGSVELHTEHYGPVRLEAGDSCYYDAPMGHAFIRAGSGPALILNITAHRVATETIATLASGAADES